MRDAETARHGRDVSQTLGLPDTNVGTRETRKRPERQIIQKGAPRNRGALLFLPRADRSVKQDEK